ncbi:hypothetical protein ASE98_19530 [Pseudomonas sp. Leaf48]|jgi:hypothetical protein|uniref:hypothetical protein n=1 Tax=Pseudomonas sp. Leaf48 TaxID=1736221 RepID=UPI0007282C19|nr:hypothetical protein [Pseudomonas sp. Leaf48]KQN53282.1 hypothetical protein ASE98_19530 [Pseudomonas sp. Leaf48]
MDIDENAPGNISQQAVTRTTDNEAGHDPARPEAASKTREDSPDRGESGAGNDRDSPVVTEPQTDTAPNNPKPDPAAKENAYSPDFKSEPEHKPVQDADIDTPGG